jgi:aminomethyltransferase
MKYTSIAEEHLAVREACGLFDVSHMGEIFVRGPGAEGFLQRVTSNDVSKLEVLSAQYSTVLNERGGVKDDVFVYRTGEYEYMLVTNAVNVEKIFEWFKQHASSDVEIRDITQTTLMLALQGPRAQEVLQGLTDFELSELKRFKAARMQVAELEVLVSRTGYTGEDGFELYLTDVSTSDPTRAERLWDAILHAGENAGIKPCGLGARNTARLEAGYVLYGYELTEDITPYEARIGFVVKLEKGEFIGRDALAKQKEVGIKRERIGLRMCEPGVPREGCRILIGNREIGRVTSGTFSPLLKIGIAMGYTGPDLAPGTEVSVEIRGKCRAAEVVEWPFYDPERYGFGRK